MLFDPAGENYQVSLQVALIVAATMAAMIGFAAKIVQVRRAPVVTGESELVGQIGVEMRLSTRKASFSSTASSGAHGRTANRSRRARRFASRVSTKA